MNLNCKKFNELTENEQQNVRSLGWTLFKDEISVTASEFEDSIVIYDDVHVVAMLNLDPMEDTIYISHLEVLKKRTGYGREIVKELRDGFKSNYKRIMVDAKDINSYRFWKAMGFKDYGEDLILDLK